MAALNVSGRRCVVVGGDEQALTRARHLLDGGARVLVVASEPVAELRDLAAAARLELRSRYSRAAIRGAFLVMTTDADTCVQQRVWRDARAERALVNTADRPELCDFFSPALVRRGALQLAVSTSGESPYLAGALRERLERSVGEEWGQLAAMIGTVRRRLRRRAASPSHQRRAYRRLLQPDVRRALRHGRYEEAAAVASSLMDGLTPAGSVTIVGAGPGDPGLLTAAALDALATADVVFHDALVSDTVLACCGSECRRVAVGKRAGRHAALQEDINAALIESARCGAHVVRLKGGDPFVFGRGGEEVLALAGAGVSVSVIPGVSTATAAPALAGIPLTHRGVASSFGVISAQLRSGSCDSSLERLAATVDTLVVLMPLAELSALTERLATVVGGDRPAALVGDASLPEQVVACAPLSELAAGAAAAGVQAPATLVVGRVVELCSGWRRRVGSVPRNSSAPASAPDAPMAPTRAPSELPARPN
jgi:uroporphyrin-III C-methyltransferase/precorrin-2 dehydrogenase/sirohydrochlorin ferrochelatase